MLEAIAIALIVIAVAAAALLAYAATLPKTFRLVRSTAIQAPPERVFPLIADFREWRKWSPWENMDTDLKRVYGGAERGTGATYAWEGRKAGAGRMEITEAAAPSHVGLRLDFTRPFKASNTVDFEIAPKPAGSEVTWAMRGDNSLLSRVFQVFVDIDRMVGRDFEKGLAAIKAEAEK